ncbi:SecDF P1 head subdomain-containing protein [Nocardiopsis trehalosi]|uniref:SecDF P1 head subdomain-containing protein n=1 Tax=Nocardiopsis trehalosi TaxID=109329 RepID=UPI0008379685|nr:hypothetical protein [Nocardiopsis trehalosi]
MSPFVPPPGAVRPRARTPWLLYAAIPAAFAVLVGSGALGWVLWSQRPGGGETVVLQLGLTGDTASAEEVDRVADILRRRIEGVGAGTPVLTPAGDTLSVELPRGVDRRAAVALMVRPGALTLHPVVGVSGGAFPAPEPPRDRSGGPGTAGTEGGITEEELQELLEAAEADAAETEDVALVLPDPDASQDLQLGPARIGNAEIATAEAAPVEAGSGWQVTLTFDDEGGPEWTRLTGEAACHPQGDPRRRVAVVLDEEIATAPEVMADVACDAGATDARTVVAGRFTEGEARTLAVLVQAEALPVEIAQRA